MSSETEHELSVALFRAVRLFIANATLVSQQVAEKLGLHQTDMQFLNLLDLVGPMTPSSLAQQSGLSPGGVTIVVDRLVKAGYAKRMAKPGDRRSLLVGIRPIPHKRIKSNYESAQRALEGVLVGFTKRDIETLLRFFAAANVPPSARSNPGQRRRL